MKTVTVTLKEPLPGHHGPIASLTVREPTAAEYFTIGDPVASGERDGVKFTTINDEALYEYIKRCVDCDPILIGRLCLIDAIKVKRAVVDFFGDALSAM
jgi:hypothetical protein